MDRDTPDLSGADLASRRAPEAEIDSMTDSYPPDRDNGGVPAFVTIGVAVPVLIAATILVGMAHWSIMLSSLVIASLVAVCCISGQPGVAAFLAR